MIRRQTFRSIEASKKYGSEIQLWDRILFESNHFISVPSLGQLVPGWLLIAPKERYLCIGAIPTSMFEELIAFIDRVTSFVKLAYGPITIFEHGPVQAKTSIGCGVDHAHVHIVPIKSNWSLLQEAKRRVPQICWESALSIKKTKKYYSINKPYLYLYESASNIQVIGNNSSIPSQLFRKIIAHYIDRPREYDWKEYPELKNIQATIERLNPLANISV